MEHSSNITRSRSRYSTSHGSQTPYSSAVYLEDEENKEGEPLLSVSERSIINVSDDDGTEADPREIDKEATSVSHWRCPTRAGIKRNCRIRCLTSKPVVFILALNALVCYAFFGLTQTAVVQSVLQDTTIKSKSGLIAVIQQGLENGVVWLCYPLGGLLADVYVGRHLTMSICLLIIWLANAVFSLSAAIGSNLAGLVGAAARSALLTWLPAVCLVVNSIGGGVFQISLLVFGGDQLCDAPSDVVSSYIYWVYWTKNLGVFLGWLLYTGVAIMQPLDADIKQLNFVPALQPMLAVMILTVAIVFDICTSKYYDAEHKNTNPIQLICGVIRNSKQWRRPPPFMSAFRYGEDPPSGLDFARQHHGGRYTDEEVEDVRTFGRVMVFILSLSAFLLPYNGLRSMTSYQMSSCAHLYFNTTERTPNIIAENYLLTNLEPLLNSFFVLLLIPIYNNVVAPLMGLYWPNMRKRIGLGVILIVLAAATSTLLELNATETPSNKTLWFILPVFLTGAAEVSAASPILEFIYAQSPDNMKGLLIGLFYLLSGIWNILANVIIYYVTQQDDCSRTYIHPQNNTVFWYYCSFTILGVVGLVIYLTVAYRYKNRRRNNPVSDIMRVSMYF